MECVELNNWLCKRMKKIRSSQAPILVLKWVKQIFPVSIVKNISILNATIKYILSTEWFTVSSFFCCMCFWKAIYKTRNTGTGNIMRGMRGMFTRISGNLLEDSGERYYFNFPGNVEEYSGECSKRFRRMLVKIPGNVGKGSRKYSKRLNAL